MIEPGHKRDRSGHKARRFAARQADLLDAERRQRASLMELVDRSLTARALEPREGGRSRGVGRPGADDTGPHNGRLLGLIEVIAGDGGVEWRSVIPLRERQPGLGERVSSGS